MMSADNVMVVRRYFEEFLSAPGKLEIATDIFTPDIVFENPISDRKISGIEAYCAFALRWYEGFPDRRFTLKETISEGDRIAARFTIEATHLGPFGGSLPTGNRILINGVNLFRTSGGKIRHVHAFFNPLELWRPLGLPGDGRPRTSDINPTKVKDAVTAYVTAFLIRDRAAFLDAFTDDATIVAPVGSAPIVGKAAVGTFFDGVLGSFDTIEFKIEELFVAADEAALVFSLTGTKQTRVTPIRGVDVFHVDARGRIFSVVGYH